jgi:hypothetical protein
MPSPALFLDHVQHLAVSPTPVGLKAHLDQPDGGLGPLMSPGFLGQQAERDIALTDAPERPGDHAQRTERLSAQVFGQYLVKRAQAFAQPPGGHTGLMHTTGHTLPRALEFAREPRQLAGERLQHCVSNHRGTMRDRVSVLIIRITSV